MQIHVIATLLFDLHIANSNEEEKTISVQAEQTVRQTQWPLFGNILKISNTLVDATHCQGQMLLVKHSLYKKKQTLVCVLKESEH